jgi:hypothetical protein
MSGSSTTPSRKQRCFLDAGKGRNPSKTMCEIWKQRLSDELQFVTEVSELELEHGDLLVTEDHTFWQHAPAHVVNCKYMSQRIASKLGIRYQRTPSPQPEAEQSPPPKKQKKEKKQQPAKVQTREYKHTLGELKQMVADVEAELATDLQAEIHELLHTAELPSSARALLRGAAVHVLGHTTSAARVVGQREDAATAAAAAPVLYVTITGVALPAHPRGHVKPDEVLVID